MSHDVFADGGLSLLDQTPVTVTIPLGSLAALCISHAKDIVCAGRCGNPDCEVYSYALVVARRAIGTAFGEATGTVDEEIADLKAVNQAGLDQWLARLKERGLA